jgi:isoquinoline 1-oxidoreductase subunit beta
MIHHRPQTFEHHFSRRSCLISSGAVGGSMVLSLSLPLDEGNAGRSENSAPNAFIRIDSAGQVVLTMPRLEMGQGTSVRMLIAEELEVAPSQVDLEYVPPEEGFGADAMLQAPATGHSNVIRRILRLLGEASATARVMLIAAAARRWGVDVRLCHAYEGEVIHAATWRTLKYGELAVDAANMPIPREIALKEPRAESHPMATALPAVSPDGLGLG